jgi:hypothetical protein
MPGSRTHQRLDEKKTRPNIPLTKKYENKKLHSGFIFLRAHWFTF